MRYNFNLILAVVLSILIMFGWQRFSDHYFKPSNEITPIVHVVQNIPDEVEQEHIHEQSPRIQIKNKQLHGSMTLRGARIDDIKLLQYRQTVDPTSHEVALLIPSNQQNSFFAEVGWHGNSALPDANTLWSADHTELTPTAPVTLSWTNANGVTFKMKISIDDEYMFTVTQSMYNPSNVEVNFYTYGLVSRNYSATEKFANILHQGVVGVFDKQLKEYTYDDLKEKKSESIKGVAVSWLGLTDKYWFVAIIPDAAKYDVHNKYASVKNVDKYQVDFVGNEQKLLHGASWEATNRIFVGAKRVNTLDKYGNIYNIMLFDRAIDFGWLYFITKPIFHLLNFFYKLVGNFGVSIMLITVSIRLLMFALFSRSNSAMKKLRAVQPQIEKLREVYADNKTSFNKAVLELYQREKVNPVSGCLPLILQIPMFFALYKVLYVTIEMRHAPFFGWIRDLSAPDSAYILNLFGFLPLTLPSFLQIGVWPLLMAITMYWQQKISPQPADKTQARMMQFMPLILLFTMYNLPAGLLVYWTWNNILSIVQQYIDR